MRKGFTLLEIIITLGVLALALPALFSMIFLVIREQVKLYKLAEVKRQGDYVVSFMETSIREAAKIFNSSDTARVCRSPGSTASATPSFYFYDNHGNKFRFTLSGGVLSVEVTNAGGTPLPFRDSTLTGGKLDVSNFTMSCDMPGSYTLPIVSVSFRVRYGSGAGPEGVTRLDYQTNIKLR